MSYLKEGVEKLIGIINRKSELGLNDLPEIDATYYGSKVMSGEITLGQAAESLRTSKRLREPVDEVANWIASNF